MARATRPCLRCQRDQRSAPAVARSVDVVVADQRVARRRRSGRSRSRSSVALPGDVAGAAHHVPAGAAVRSGCCSSSSRAMAAARAVAAGRAAGRAGDRSGPPARGAGRRGAASSSGPESRRPLARDRLPPPGAAPRRRSPRWSPRWRGAGRRRCCCCRSTSAACPAARPSSGCSRSGPAPRRSPPAVVGLGGLASWRRGSRGRWPGSTWSPPAGCSAPAAATSWASRSVAARDPPGRRGRQRRGRAPPHRARPARRRPAAPGGAGHGPRRGPRAPRDRPRGRRPAGGRRPRGGQGGAEGDPRPGAGHPPGDPRGPRPRRRPVRRRRPLARAGDARGRRWPSGPPPTVESAAYFVVAEALTNVARHAARHPGRAWPSPGPATGWSSRSATTASAAPTPRRGTGLQGLRDRVTALGGTMHVVSPDGGPTTLLVDLPCAS